MSITCMLSHTYSDLRCPVCGEGFLIFAKAHNLISRTQLRRMVGEELRAQHQSMGATGAHDPAPFTVTADNCSPLDWLTAPLTFAAEAEAAA